MVVGGSLLTSTQPCTGTFSLRNKKMPLGVLFLICGATCCKSDIWWTVRSDQTAQTVFILSCMVIMHFFNSLAIYIDLLHGFFDPSPDLSPSRPYQPEPEGWGLILSEGWDQGWDQKSRVIKFLSYTYACQRANEIIYQFLYLAQSLN